MRISVVACELPHPQGTAAGRDLWAWCEGMRQLGHDLEAWVWYRSASSPDGPVPEWCRFEPLGEVPRWSAHLRAVVHPRGEVARAGWRPPEDAVAVADHLWSFPAVAASPRSVATFHFRTLMDARAVRRVQVADIQMTRAERRAGRRARLSLTYSARVGRGLGRCRPVPIAYPVPPRPVALPDEPVTGILADWSWPPNRRALGWLLEAWPQVRRAVPGARLLVAGRRLDPSGVGPLAGVTVLGPVARSEDLLGQVALVAFPCPPSSGPKVKVLEALAHGVPVVTTPAGVEGIWGWKEGAMVAPRRHFAATWARLLTCPERQRALGAAGRRAVAAHHSSSAAADARLAAFAEAFDG